ncbi:hypothetical protein PLEOSDRAFT_164093 [Pleurotus ostreatus PC15]|uniref:Uncharacterized protein n=1 Tax=Pleurotus ostreatus (strain PC15) TaxID=1137138 RepID=A0A067P3Z2_PLEO1|nr:hypothetical protein PLEOSDRAFT_164093 [Pleurotus ostreatus PC15]
MFLLSTPVWLCVDFTSTLEQLDYQTDHDTNTGLYRLFANSSGIHSSYVLQFDSHFPAPVNVRSETDARMWDHDGNGSWRRQTDLLSGLDGLNPDPGLDKNQALLRRLLHCQLLNMPAKLNGDDRWTWCDWGTWLAPTSPTSALNRSLVVCDGRLVNHARPSAYCVVYVPHDRSWLFSTSSPSVADHGIHIPLTSFHRDLVDDASSATNGWIATRRNLQSRQWGLGFPDWLLLADGHDRRRLEMLLRGQWVAHDIWSMSSRSRITGRSMGVRSEKGLKVSSIDKIIDQSRKDLLSRRLRCRAQVV